MLKVIMNKIESGFIRLLMHTFYLFHKRKLDWINALLMSIAIKINTQWIRLKYSIKPKSNPKYSILAFNREGFIKDLIEIDKRTDMEILYFPLMFYGKFAKTFLPPKLRSQLAYHVKDSSKEFKSPWLKEAVGNNVIKEAEDKKYKQRFMKASRRVIPFIRKWLLFDAIVSANVQYYQDQAWVEACKWIRIPFLVLCKEGLGNEFWYHQQIATFQELNFRFEGFKVAVHCQAVKDIMLKGGAVAKADDIEVTGAPRTDEVFNGYEQRKRLEASGGAGDEKWIVFFDFYHYHDLMFEDSLKRGQTLWEETLDGILTVASTCKYHDIKFILKTKWDVNTAKIRTILRDRYELDERVIVSHDITFTDIARKATLVIGFRTVALIEFMCTDYQSSLLTGRKQLIILNLQFLLMLRARRIQW